MESLSLWRNHCFSASFFCRQERRPLPFPRTSARASSRNPRSAISAHSFFRRSGRGLAPWNFFKTDKDSPSPRSPLLDGRESFSCYGRQPSTSTCSFIFSFPRKRQKRSPCSSFESAKLRSTLSFFNK
ncbi:hypothetical protein J2Z58_003020 [Halobacillus andaensis]|nr:hypothetical protein [Halobacillus andaensis]